MSAPKRLFYFSGFLFISVLVVSPSYAQSAAMPARHDANNRTATSSNADAGDISGALDYVRRDMMSIHQSSDGARCVNPTQRFNVHFPSDGGFVLTRPSDKKDGTNNWQVGLVPTAWGIKGALTPIGSVIKSETEGNDPAMPDRLENHFSSGMTEWLVNKNEGIEQGFTILSAPDGLDAVDGILFISLKTTDGTAAVSADSVGLRADDGSQVISYGKLLVTDAGGRKLPAKFIPGANGTDFLIEVTAIGASFPVIIDPLATSANWSAVGEASNDYFGSSVSTAGDVNGDGYSDVIVGGPKAYVFHGSASGIIGTAATPAWSAVGEVGGDGFGYSVSTAGDVNGDGYSDVIIGAPYNNGAGAN